MKIFCGQEAALPSRIGALLFSSSPVTIRPSESFRRHQDGAAGDTGPRPRRDPPCRQQSCILTFWASSVRWCRSTFTDG